MKVRKAVPRDIPDIRAVTLDAYSIYEEDSLIPWYNEKNIGSVKDYNDRYFSDNSCISFILEENNKIIGFAICSKSISNVPRLNPLYLPNKKLLYLFDIGIRRTTQRKGYGTFLLEYIIKWAKRNKFQNLILNTQTNSIAHKWYKKSGFIEITSEVFLNKKID